MVLLMLLAVVASSSIVRISPIPLPLPLVQIAFGVVIASMTQGVDLNPAVFFSLFLPPLLFLDGWRIPKERPYRDVWFILELALGLVLFTVIGVGLFTHWMIPTMPLAVAFGLAAVLSPTDPIAVSAVAAKVPIPKRMMRILEGESLLNDASGLTCLRFAIAAALTGSFSLKDAAFTFTWLATAGIVIGIGFTLVITSTRDWVASHFSDDIGAQILISLLIPFGAYFIAEHLGGSGILAAVAAGFTMSYVEISGRAMAVTRIRRTAVWETVSYAANGSIFVLLGEQLPRIVSNVAGAQSQHTLLQLVGYAAAILLSLLVLRFVWVLASVRFVMYRSARHGDKLLAPDWRMIFAMSLAGARGTVTLAGILTLPIVLGDGTPFPTRDLAIFLASSVIILSLLCASIGLPILLNGLVFPPNAADDLAVANARTAAAEAAMRAISRAQVQLAQGQSDPDLYADTASQVMESYRTRIEQDAQTADEPNDGRKVLEIERKLRMAGLRAERDELFRLMRERKLDSHSGIRLVRELDLTEARYT